MLHTCNAPALALTGWSNTFCFASVLVGGNSTYVTNLSDKSLGGQHIVTNWAGYKRGLWSTFVVAVTIVRHGWTGIVVRYLLLILSRALTWLVHVHRVLVSNIQGFRCLLCCLDKFGLFLDLLGLCCFVKGDVKAQSTMI